jgi:predicted DNA-binding protein
MAKQPLKAFQVRLERDTWIFLKNISAQQERSMATIIEECVKKYKKKFETVLTDSDTMVS